jgi:uncharacterized protein YgiM (DUF1202 family)
MRRKTGFLTITLSVLLMVALSVVAQAQAACPALVQEAYTATEFLCVDVPDGQACIGNGTVNATPVEGATVAFSAPGEFAQLTQIQRLQVQTLNTETQAWTSVMGKLNVTDRNNADAVVDVLIFGDAVMTNAAPVDSSAAAGVLTGTIEAAGGIIMRQDANASSSNVWQLTNGEEITVIGRSNDNQWVRAIIPSQNGGAAWVFAQFVNVEGGIDLLPFHTNFTEIPVVATASITETTYKPMQSFRIESLLTDATCADATDSGIILQSPDPENRMIVEVNGSQIRFTGTIFITAQVGDKMTIYNIEGGTIAFVDDQRSNMGVGTVVEIPMDANLEPTGVPSDAVPYSREVADNLGFLPTQLLSRDITVAFVEPSVVDNANADTSTSTDQTAPPPSATQVPAADPANCPTLIKESYTAAEFVCAAQGANSACIGNIGENGLSQSQPQAGVDGFSFLVTNDVVPATDIQSYESTVFNQPNRAWNLISMKVDANTTTGGIAEATMLTFGEVKLINTGDVAIDTAPNVPAPADVTLPVEPDVTLPVTSDVLGIINAPGGMLVRGEPAVNADTTGQLNDMDIVMIVAVSDDQLWLQVQNEDGSLVGWVFKQFVDVEGGDDALSTLGATAQPIPSTDAGTSADTTDDATADTPSADGGVAGEIQSASPIVIRNLPRVDTDSVGQLDNATPLTILGKSVDQSWLLVRSADGSIEGWIFQNFVAFTGSLDSVPVVDASADSTANTAPPPPPADTVAPPVDTAPATGGQSGYGSMQSFQLATSKIDAGCAESTDSGMVIQSPDGIDGKMMIRVNDIELGIVGTIFIRSEENVSVNIIALEGDVDVTSAGTTQTLVAGEETAVKLVNGLSADGVPNLPSTYSYSKGSRLPYLPLRLLPRSVTPIVPEDTSAAPVVEADDTSAEEASDGVTPVQSDVVAIGGTIVDFAAECEISAGDRGRNLRAGAGTNFDVSGTLQPGQTIEGVSQKRGNDGLYWYETARGWIRFDAGIMSADCANLPLYGVIYDPTGSGDTSSAAPAAPVVPEATAVPPPPIVSEGYGDICGSSGSFSISAQIDQSGTTFIEFGGVWTARPGSYTFSAETPYFRPELGNVITFVNDDGSPWLGSIDAQVFTLNLDSQRRFRVRVAGLVGDYITLRVQC